MEVGSPAWIEASLAKLETLERERDQHEAALESASDPLTLKDHNDAVARLDGEIKALYAQLEAVAGEEEEQQDEEDEGEVLPRNTQGDDELSAPHLGTTPMPEPLMPAPMESPLAAAAERPFGSGGVDAPPPISYDDDLQPKGGGAKWAFLGVVAFVGVSVGGYFVWQNMQANQPKAQAQPAEEIKVEAAQIREDTEAPNAAKGGDATISPTAKGHPTGSSSGGSSGGSGGSSNSGGKKPDGKKNKPIELKTSDGDPLG